MCLLFWLSDWVKVQFDLNEGIIYLHYIPNAKNCELEILNIHQRLDVNCVNVGTFVDFGKFNPFCVLSIFKFVVDDNDNYIDDC